MAIFEQKDISKKTDLKVRHRVNVPALKSIAGDEMIPARFLARHL